ncbi:MAG: anti-sigma F factor [Lachnospiraceae bacterium]
MKFTNEMEITMKAIPENESFSRMVVAAFAAPLNPTLEELGDLKTAISEAVTNSIIHGYEKKEGNITITGYANGMELTFIVTDHGIGMEDVAQAMTPLYTSKPELERSGMGFSFMEAFMDEVVVESVPGQGTKVIMKKNIGVEKWRKPFV